MSVKNRVILLEKVGTNGNIIKIRFNQEISPRRSVAYIAAAFDKCFKNNYFNIILDLGNVPEVSNKFIATIIEATVKVRRKAGDIKIINIPENVKNIVAGFNAYLYLSVESEV